MQATSERRRIAVVSADRHVDIAVPLDDSLGEALARVGYSLVPGRHVVLDRNGTEADIHQLAEKLHDGALFAIVDLDQHETEQRGHGRGTELDSDSGRLWWMLGTAAVLIAMLAILSGGLGASTGGAERIVAGIVLSLGAVASAVTWAVRRRQDATEAALAMLAPAALAFAAGVVLVPVGLEAATHLSLVVGLSAAGILSALLTATVGSGRLRSAMGTATIILLSLAALWAITLLAGWTPAVAAAISAGSVPLALRFLPTTLVNVPEGYHINYDHFMSNRWTVRGAIPESPGAVRMSQVRSIVDESSARLATGTVLLSVAAAAFLPIALTGPLDSDGFVLGGTIGFVVFVVIALTLIPRHGATPVSRWMPRAAAAVILLVATVVFAERFGGFILLAAASGLLLLGLLAAAVLVPIGRGASSLAWSRIADVFEALAIALSLPSALLAADILTLLREMMAA